MKRVLVLTLLLAVLLAGCSGKTAETDIDTVAEELIEEEEEEGVVKISEKLFIAQTNDIYLNPEDYLGSVIKYEGMYKVVDWADEKAYRYVIRYGPGCCGYDGEAGFEVAWDGEWPEVDDWCEVVGVLGEYADENGWKYLYLELTSLTVLDERGAEFVNT